MNIKIQKKSVHKQPKQSIEKIILAFSKIKIISALFYFDFMNTAKFELRFDDTTYV